MKERFEIFRDLHNISETINEDTILTHTEK